MRKLPAILFVLALVTVFVPAALAGGPADCPDHDGDGICNGQDPDYTPGDSCPDAQCPNPDCPDADGDGICNGQDPDYAPTGDGPRHHGHSKGMTASLLRALMFLGFSF